MQSQLVLTVIADDRTGLVEQVANAVAAAGGNWLESSMSQLAGQFAGIALVTVPTAKQAALESALADLAEHGIQIFLQPAGDDREIADQLLLVHVVANDRPGIVQEVTRLLATLNINVESFDTTCGSAAMSSAPVFEASAVVALPEGLSEDQLAARLESLSDDLMVEIQELVDEEE